MSSYSLADAGRAGGVEKLILFLLGLASMAAFGTSWQFLVVAGLLCLVSLGARIGSLEVPIAGVLLALFLLSRAYLNPGSGLLGWVLALMAFFSFFVAYVLSSSGWAGCRRVLLAIVAGSAAHALMNAAFIVREHGFVPTTRLFDDVWTGELWVATGQATAWVPVVGAIPYLIFGSRSRPTVVTGGILLILALYASAILASRTLFGLIVLSMLIGCGSLLAQRGRRGHFLAGTFVAAIVSLSLFLALPQGLFDRLPLVSRLSSGGARLGEDPRLERWSYYMGHAWESATGASDLRSSVGYAHNLWLDSLDADGILPFVLLVLFSLSFLVGLKRIAREFPPSAGERLLIHGLGATWVIQAATEPLIDLAPYLFAAGCGFAGATAGLLRSLEKGSHPLTEVPRVGRPQLFGTV